MLYGKLIKPLLFSLPPEQAHHIVTATLSLLGKVPGGRWLLHKLYATEDPSLEREVFGIRFKNPVGMAAGFDRYGHIYRELSAMGFGFVEVGSITPKRQPGNPKPRIFRLDAARALLNRVGICSHGLDRAVAHLRQPRGEAIVGCNIGKNTATPCDQAPADYLKCFRNLYQYADYFTINVACDPGQKAASYQTRENITKILEPLFEFRRGQNQYRPILLKVSPDLSDETIDLMTDIMLDTPLDGMVAVNATVSREGVDRLEATRIGAGVVSGQPLTQRALEVVRRIHTRSQGTYPIIGVGGLMTPDDVRAMLDAGAALVQIYTGYIYNDPGYVREICRALMDKDEYKPSIVIEESFSKVDSLRKSCQSYFPYMNPSQVFSELQLDYPVISQDNSILLSEITVTGKKGRVFRDKMMGRLDSLAQMKVGAAWVCSGCISGGGNIEYLNDYKGYSHHPIGCPVPPPGKISSPVIGRKYYLIKYEPKGENNKWILTKLDEIIWKGEEFTEEELLRMNNLWRVKGYYGTREFYQPDELDVQSPLPDARNVLLWKPDIVTDEKGIAEVEFFCSDINTSFVGVVEGTDGLGNLGTSQCEFRVLKP